MRTERTENQALSLKLMTVLARAFSAVEVHTHADIARHGLTISEFGVLEALHHKGPMLLGELQRKTLVSSGGMTYVVDRLEEKGWVERRPCATDRRASYAALTREGEALIRRIFPEHVRCLEHAFGGLNRAEKREVIELLRKLGTAAAERQPCGAASE